MLPRRIGQIVFIFVVSTLFVVAAFIFVWQGQDALAGIANNTSGWAWPQNIGWISFNSTNSLVAYWKMDEGTGQTVADSVGTNDGTLGSILGVDTNDPAWNPSGKIGGALEFDGQNDYVDASSFGPHTYNNFTISVWYKSNDTGVSNDEDIYIHRDLPADTNQVEFGPTNDSEGPDTVRLVLLRETGFQDFYGTSDVVDQQWHHLAAVRTDTRIKIYVDGVEETDEADSFAGLPISIVSSTVGPFIGSDPAAIPGKQEQVDGFIDDLRIYGRALQAAEITESWNEGNGLPLEDYGVHVNSGPGPTKGDFSGYAWSENLGWMKLDPTTPPAAPFISAKLDLNNGAVCGGAQYDVCGWARICSAVADKTTCEGSKDPTAGGWDGWVKLRADPVAPLAKTPPTDYVTYWKLDELSGTVAKDSSSNGRHGNLINMVGDEWTTGQINGGLEFDGVEDYVNVPDNDGSDLTDDGTIAAWTKFNSTDAEESNFYPWLLVCEQNLGATPPLDTCGIPGTTDNNDGYEVDMTVVGDRLYFAALLLSNSTETFWVGNSALDGTDFSGWAGRPAPNGAGSGETVSVAIDSDGDRLYYAAFAHNSAEGRFYTGDSNLAGADFSGWTEHDPIVGKAGGGDYNQIDMIIVDEKMYFAAYLHDNETEYFETANVDLDGTPSSFSGWLSHAAPDGAGVRASTSVAIDSDGKRLYYAAFTHQSDSSADNFTPEFFYLADSSLDAADFSNWIPKVAPDGTGWNDQSTIDMTIVGDKMYFAALLHADRDVTFSSANIDLDGTDFSGWEVEGRRGVGGGGGNDTSSVAIASNGRNLFYSAFTNGDDNKRFYLTFSQIDSRPIIYKEGAYELLQVGRGFVLNWAGAPKSFGSIVGPFNNVGVTHDGRTMIYYVNGQEERRQTVSRNFAGNSSPLRIGGHPPTIPSPPADLVGHWRFDEGLGQIVGDSSFSGSNDGTRGADAGVASDDPLWYSDTILGDFALDFDDGDEVVTIPTAASLNPSDEVTVTAWLNIDNDACTKTDGTLVAKSDGPMDSGATSLRYALWYEGEGVRCTDQDLVFCVNDSEDNGPNCVEVDKGMRGSWPQPWTLYSGTYDGSELRVYRDETLMGSKSLSTTITGGAGSDITIGQAYVGGSQRITGRMNDVRVYDRALSQEEIVEIFREQEYSGYFDGVIDDVRLYKYALKASEMLDIFNLGGGGAVAYGVSWNPGTKELEGWAWGSDVVGWVSFNNLNCDANGDGSSDGSPPGCPVAGTPVSDYQVIVDITADDPPEARNLTVPDQNYCGFSTPPVFLEWRFQDSGPDPQLAYQVQIDDEPSFSLPLIVDSCIPPLNSCAPGTTSEQFAPSGLSYDTTYWWRVQVWDVDSETSGWVYPPDSPILPGVSFTTKKRHPDPSVFNWSPNLPAAEEVVQFNDNTTFSGPPAVPGVPSWEWDFDGSGSDSTLEDPTHTYPDNDPHFVELEACADGRCCSSIKQLRPTSPFPKWREVTPF